MFRLGEIRERKKVTREMRNVISFKKNEKARDERGCPQLHLLEVEKKKEDQVLCATPHARRRFFLLKTARWG